MNEIAIAQIRIGKRFRKDLGNIQELADSIRDVGLLHPIVVDDKADLVAGFRRIMAAKKLGWRKIECSVISIDDLRIGEIQENTNRKDFTASEIADIAAYIERTRIGHRPQKVGKLPTLPGPTREVTAKITGVSPRTVTKIKKIKEAAEKQPKKYAHILERVDSKKLSVDTAHKIVTREERNLPKVPLPKGKFDVIYADPAIRFDNRSINGAADNNYETIPIEEIARGIFNGENVRNIIADNAVCFMWFPTSIMLDETITAIADGYAVSIPNYKYILNSWGFDTIKTDFVWDKKAITPGDWSKNRHETLIMGIKGKMPTPAERFDSVYEEQRTRTHSQKPIYYYSMIEQMYPKRKYVELWAKPQVRRPHWTYWGNQAESIPA